MSSKKVFSRFLFATFSTAVILLIFFLNWSLEVVSDEEGKLGDAEETATSEQSSRSSAGTNTRESASVEINPKASSSSQTGFLDKASKEETHFILNKRNYTVERDPDWRFIRREYESNERTSIARTIRGDTLLVGLSQGADRQELEILLSDLGMWIEDENVELDVLRLRLSEVQLDELWSLHSQLMERNDLFRYVEPEHLYPSASVLPDDPQLSAPGSWGIAAMNFPASWAIASSAPIIVAVIDSGIDLTHPDLDGAIWVNRGEIPNNGIDDDDNGYVDDVNGWNVARNNNEINDSEGHGTAVAGIIGAIHNNSREMAGAAPFSIIMPVKNTEGGLSSTFDSANALTYAVNNGAQVVNMSFGHGSLSFTFDGAVALARSNGVIMVASSGNDGLEGNPNFPARFDGVLSVGALDSNGNRPSYSNYGVDVDLMAPGHGVLTLRADGASIGVSSGSYLTTVNGTSFAAPYVTSAAAFLLQRNPAWGVDQILSALQSAGSGIENWTVESGIGFADVARADSIVSPIETGGIEPANGHVFRDSIRLGLTASNAEEITAYFQTTGEVATWQPLVAARASSLSHVWDTSELSDGQYTIRFEITNTDQTLNVFRVLNIAHSAPYYQKVAEVNGSRITTADLDSDGDVELLYAPFRGLAAFRPHSGYLQGWPLGNSPYEPGYTGNAFQTYGHNYGGSSCGDIDGDGQLEVAIFHAPENNEWGKSVLTVTDNQGSILPDLVRRFDNGRTHYSSSDGFVSPVFADLNSDGKDEIIYVSGSRTGVGRIHVMTGDGVELSGWPVSLSSGHIACYGTPAIGDFDGDGSLEVALMTNLGRIEMFTSKGERLSGWPRDFDTSSNQEHFLIFADFDHDANLELFVASTSGRMTMFERDGSTASGWPRSWAISNPPSVGNIDDDSELEIVFPATNEQHAINHDGSPLAGWPQSASSALGMAILADVDGDGSIDIYNSEYSQRIVCWDQSGDMLSSLGFPIATRYYGESECKAAGDLDNDGLLEISCRKYEKGFHLYELNTLDVPGSLEHGMFHLSAGRQNRYTSPESTAVLNERSSERNASFLTINGHGFLAGSALFAEGDAAHQLEIVSITPEQIVFSFPDGLPEGAYSLTLKSHANHVHKLPGEFVMVDSYEGDSDGDLMTNGWELTHQLDPFDDGSLVPARGPTGDEDNDGIPNRVEFALRGMNLSPSKRDTLASVIDPAIKGFRFSFDDNTEVQCWISSDLVTWAKVDASMDATKYDYEKSLGPDGLHRITIQNLQRSPSFIRFSVPPQE